MERIPKEINWFRRNLLTWWRQNRIDYPWRSYTDPFSILISEILLRKTNAEKVQNFISQTLKRINSPKKIKTLKQEKIEKLLEPYGMQKKKAKELKQLADSLIINHRGHLPDKPEELGKLPGVGTYITNAVLCAGFGKKYPIIDTNVIRIYQRFFRYESKKKRPRDDKEMWAFAERLLPKYKYREFNYALLDFGKKVCRARKPQCENCPLASHCPHPASTQV